MIGTKARGRFLLLAFLCLLAGGSDGAAAENREAEADAWGRAGLSIGGYMLAIDSEVGLGLKGLQTNINMEEALDLDVSYTVFRADGFYRFTANRRHRLDLSWYALRREGLRRLTQDLTIGDTTYLTGTTVASSFNLDIYKLAYSYSLFQDDRMDLAAGIGAYVMPIELAFSSVGGVQENESESFTAPLPVITLRTDFAITPKLYLLNRIDLFYMQIGSYKGGITNLNIALEYMFFKRFSAGLGFETFNLKVNAENSSYPPADFVGEINYRNVGLMGFLKYQF
ncbi:MAG: hypothetical protein ACOZF0_07450 [Thermodesulfobacteriota bacterium]